MRFLINNPVTTATISTTVPNGNYPVDNIAHPFLRRRYQAAISPATITVTFASDETVNCIMYGWHNLTSLTLRLYDSGDTLLDTQTPTVESGTGAHYFASVSSVAYAEVDIASASTPYLGGLGIGEYFEPKRVGADVSDPGSGFSEEVVDNTVVSGSPTGQVQSDYVEPMISESYVLMDITRAHRDTVRQKFNSVGIGYPIWIDAFHADHDYHAPYYGRLTAPVASSKNGRRYNVEIELQEAR